MTVESHSCPQSPSFLGHVVGKRGALATGRLQIKPSGSGDENGRIMSENLGVYIAMKSAVKAMNGFCITRVMDVLSVFTFSYLKCLHSWRSIWNFRKIFVAEGNSYIFFVPFSYEHFTFHVYSLSLKCRLVRFDCVDTNRANKNYHTWQQSLAVHFISSFINHKWHWKEI